MSPSTVTQNDDQFGWKEHLFESVSKGVMFELARFCENLQRQTADESIERMYALPWHRSIDYLMMLAPPEFVSSAVSLKDKNDLIKNQ